MFFNIMQFFPGFARLIKQEGIFTMKRLLVLLLMALLLTACAAPADNTFATMPPATAVPAHTAEATRAAIQVLDFDPAQVGTLQSATLTWTHMSNRSVIHTGALTDPEKLRVLERILTSAEPMTFITQCFESTLEHELTLVRSDGSVMTVLVALDDCPTLRHGNTCYDFKAAANSNTAIYDLFGAKIR